MSEIKLKPCPFCGATLRRNCLGNGEHDKDDCILAAIEIPVKYFPMWNTRIPMQEIVERLEEKTEFLKDCTKYGNKDAEQVRISYSTMMMYEVASLVEDMIDIVKEVGGIDG